MVRKTSVTRNTTAQTGEAKAGGRVQPRPSNEDTSNTMTLFVIDPSTRKARALMVGKNATVAQLKALIHGTAKSITTQPVLIHQGKTLSQEDSRLTQVGVQPWTTVTLGGPLLLGGSQLKDSGRIDDSTVGLVSESQEKGKNRQERPEVTNKVAPEQLPLSKLAKAILATPPKPMSSETCFIELSKLRAGGSKADDDQSIELAKNAVEGYKLKENQKPLERFFSHVFSDEKLKAFYLNKNEQLHAWLGHNPQEIEIIQMRALIQTAMIIPESDRPDSEEKMMKMKMDLSYDREHFSEELMRVYMDQATNEIKERVQGDIMLIFERLSMAQFFELLKFVSIGCVQRIFDYERTPLKLRYVLELVQSALHPYFYELLDTIFVNDRVKSIEDLKDSFKRLYGRLIPTDQFCLLEITSNGELVALMSGKGASRALMSLRDKALDAKANLSPAQVLHNAQAKEVVKAVRQVSPGQVQVLGWTLLRNNPDFLLCAEKHDFSGGKTKISAEMHQRRDELLTKEIIERVKSRFPEVSQSEIDEANYSYACQMEQYETDEFVLDQQRSTDDLNTTRFYLSLTDTTKLSNALPQRTKTEELIPFPMSLAPNDPQKAFFFHGMDKKVFWFSKKPPVEQQEVQSLKEKNSFLRMNTFDSSDEQDDGYKPTVTLCILGEKSPNFDRGVKRIEINPESKLYSLLINAMGLKSIEKMGKQEGSHAHAHAFHHPVPTLVKTESKKMLIVYSDFEPSEGYPKTYFYCVEQGKEVAEASGASMFLGFYKKEGGGNRALFFVDSYLLSMNLNRFKLGTRGGEWRKQEAGYPQLYEVAFDSEEIYAHKESSPLKLIPCVRDKSKQTISRIEEKCETQADTAALLKNDENWIFVENGKFSNDASRPNYVNTNKVVRVSLVSRTDSCFELVIQNLARGGGVEIYERDESDVVKRCIIDGVGKDKDLILSKLRPYSAQESSLKMMRHSEGIVVSKKDDEPSDAIKSPYLGQSTQAVLRQDGTLLLAFQDNNQFSQVNVEAVKLRSQGGQDSESPSRHLARTGFINAYHEGSYMCCHLGGNEVLISNINEPDVPDILLTSNTMSILLQVAPQAETSTTSSTQHPSFSFLARYGIYSNPHLISISLCQVFDVFWGQNGLKGVSVHQQDVKGHLEELQCITHAKWDCGDLVGFVADECTNKVEMMRISRSQNSEVINPQTEQTKVRVFCHLSNLDETMPTQRMLCGDSYLSAQVKEVMGDTSLQFTRIRDRKPEKLPSKNSGRILGFFTEERALFVLDEKLQLIKYAATDDYNNPYNCSEKDTRDLSQVRGLREAVDQMKPDEQLHLTGTHIIIKDTCFALDKGKSYKIRSFQGLANDARVSSVRSSDSLFTMTLETVNPEDGRRSFAIAPYPFKRSIGYALPTGKKPHCLVSPNELLMQLELKDAKTKWVLLDIYEWRSKPMSSSLQSILLSYTEAVTKWLFVPQLDGSKLLMLQFQGDRVCLIRFDFSGNFVQHDCIEPTEGAEIDRVHVNQEGRVLIHQKEKPVLEPSDQDRLGVGQSCEHEADFKEGGEDGGESDKSARDDQTSQQQARSLSPPRASPLPPIGHVAAPAEPMQLRLESPGVSPNQTQQPIQSQISQEATENQRLQQIPSSLSPKLSSGLSPRERYLSPQKVTGSSVRGSMQSKSIRGSFFGTFVSKKSPGKSLKVTHEKLDLADLQVTRLASTETVFEGIEKWDFCISDKYLVLYLEGKETEEQENRVQVTLKHYPLNWAKREQTFEFIPQEGLRLDQKYSSMELCCQKYGPNYLNGQPENDLKVKRHADRIQLTSADCIDIFEVSAKEISFSSEVVEVDKLLSKDQHVAMSFNLASVIKDKPVRFVEEANERSIFLEYIDGNLRGIQRMYSEADLTQLIEILEMGQNNELPDSVDKELLLTCIHDQTFFAMFQDRLKLLKATFMMLDSSQQEEAEGSAKALDSEFLRKLTAVLLRPQHTALKAPELKRTRKSVLQSNLTLVPLRDTLLRFGRLNPSFSLFEIISDQNEFSEMLSKWSPQLLEELNSCFLETPSSERIKTLDWPGSHEFITFKQPHCKVTKEELQKLVQEKKKRYDEVSPNTPVRVSMFDLTWVHRGGSSFADLNRNLKNKMPNEFYESKFLVYLIEQIWQSKRVTLFVLYFLPYLALLVATLIFNLNALADRAEESYNHDWNLPLGVLILCLWLYFLRFEVQQIIDHRTSGNFSKYLRNFWNKIDFVYLVLLPIVVICSLPLVPWVSLRTLRVFAALTSFSQMVKIYDWMRLVTYFNFYIQLLEETFKDIVAFMLLLLFTLTVFGMPLVILDLNRLPGAEVVDSVFGIWTLDMLLNQYLLTLGEFSLDNFSEGSNTTYCYVVFLGATFCSQVTMLNMLIAIMGDTFERVVENRETIRIRTSLNFFSELPRSIGKNTSSQRREFLFVIERDLEDDASHAEQAGWQGPFRKMTKTLEQRSIALEHKITKHLQKMEKGQLTAQERDQTLSIQVKQIQSSVNQSARDLFSLEGRLKLSLAKTGPKAAAGQEASGISDEAQLRNSSALMIAIRQMMREEVRGEVRQMQTELSSLKELIKEKKPDSDNNQSSAPAKAESDDLDKL